MSRPPLIAGLGVDLDSAVVADLERAMREITALDSEGSHLLALSPLLLRTEWVASSKIEAIEANLDDYAQALHGIRTNSSAVSMAAATSALATLIDDVAVGGRIEVAALTTAHAVLMRDDPSEAAYAGRVRDMQNWIGGSDHAPRNALYVPPPPETVTEYLDDLVAFANRDDLPALAQAALAHAQFESIHPFTDGNGRIGRALINTVLRRRGATSRIVVPLASALVAHRERYFDVLNAYRRGEIEPLLTSFATASRISAHEGRRCRRPRSSSSWVAGSPTPAGDPSALGLRQFGQQGAPAGLAFLGGLLPPRRGAALAEGDLGALHAGAGLALGRRVAGAEGGADRAPGAHELAAQDRGGLLRQGGVGRPPATSLDDHVVPVRRRLGGFPIHVAILPRRAHDPRMIDQAVLDRAWQRQRQRVLVVCAVILVMPVVLVLAATRFSDRSDGHRIAILMLVEIGISVGVVVVLLATMHLLRRRGIVPAPLLGLDKRGRKRVLRAVRTGRHLHGPEEAVARGRNGEGPSLIEAVTMRMHGHAEHDPADYVPKEMFDEWSKKDPVELFEKTLLEAGVLDEETAAKTREKARQDAIAARKKAMSDPMPEPSGVEVGVYAD